MTRTPKRARRRTYLAGAGVLGLLGAMAVAGTLPVTHRNGEPSAAAQHLTAGSVAPATGGATHRAGAAGTGTSASRPVKPVTAAVGQTTTAAQVAQAGHLQPRVPPHHLRAVADPVRVHLPHPMRGKAATRALGGSGMATVARQARLTTTQLRQTLLTDPTMWVSQQGQLYSIDPVPAGTHAPTAKAFTQQQSSTTSAAGATVPDVSNLHSDPGAPVEIYLDFTGATVQDTYWNTQQELPNGTVPAWDPAGDGAGFSTDEQNAIYEIWQRVAEDYAPFDVDVTTHDDGTDALHAASSEDPTYGTTVLITSDTAEWQSLCAEQCGGIANVGALGQVDPEGRLDYAWVFGAGLQESPESIAEAAAHEAGHTFGLTHQGDQPNTDLTSYDLGHNLWAPIMGAGYYHAVTQWANGSYAGANNQQDELAQIEKLVSLRTDEAGDSPATATAVPTGTAYITSQSDIDTYALGSCAAGSTLSASPAAVGADLDLHLSVVDSTGATVADVDPADTESAVAAPVAWAPNTAEMVATGLDAQATLDGSGVAPYYLQVRDGGGEAGGAGDPTADFNTYGSLGAYTVSVHGCDDPATAPSAPQRATGSVTASGLSVSWQAPANSGGTTITGYQVSVDGGAWNAVANAATTYTDPTITTGNHTVAIQAVNAVGTGPSASTNVAGTTIPGAPQLYGTPQVLPTCDFDETLQCYQFSWTAPTDDGGSPIVKFNFYVDGLQMPSVAYSGNNTVYGEQTNLEPGVPSDIRVTAVNAVGEGIPLDLSGLIPGPPEAIVGATSTSDRVARTATVTWPDPPFDGGAPVTSYELWVYPNQPGSAAGPDVVTTGHSWTFTNVKYGGRPVDIAAVNSYGPTKYPGGTSIIMPLRSPLAVAPTGLTVIPHPASGSADISWNPVQIPDPDAVIGYDVCAQNPNTDTGEAAAPAGISVADGEDTGDMDVCSDGTKATWVTSPQATLTGLTPGTMYDLSVQAVNPGGPGYGVTQLLIENAPAGPVANLNATASVPSLDNPSITATWDPPADLGGAPGVTEYEVRLDSADGPGTWQPIYGMTSYTWQTWNAPLTPGDSYTVDVRADTTGAYSTNYTGAITSTTVTLPATATPPPPPTAPGQVINLTAVADKVARTVAVTWEPPADPGTGGISEYYVALDGGSSIATRGATSYTFTDVATGDHTVVVDAGNGADLNSLTQVAVTMPPPPTAPGVVTGLKVTGDAAHGAATVTWQPLASDGGSAVTGYVVLLGTQQKTLNAGTRTARFTGLRVGTSYSVTVAAVNTAGRGSLAHGSVLLRLAPGVPQLSVAPGAKGGPLTITATWKTPATNGAALTGYQVRIETLNSKGTVVSTKTYAVKASAHSLPVALKAGQYKVSVRAGNAVGWGAYGAWSTTVSPR